MPSIRKIVEKKQVVPTNIPGFYIKALTIKEAQNLSEKRTEFIRNMQDDDKAEELTMSLFSLACDENGESFDEFATYDELMNLSLDEFNTFATAIREALTPGDQSEKK